MDLVSVVGDEEGLVTAGTSYTTSNIFADSGFTVTLWKFKNFRLLSDSNKKFKKF